MRFPCLPTLAVLIAAACPALAQKKPKPEEAGLGPTGIISEVTPGKANVTVEGTQPGSPADGKLKKGDVISHMGDRQLSGNLKGRSAQLSEIFDQAEADGGKLALQLTDGRKLTLQLEPLGGYSATAPFDCPKTDKIITRAADAILREVSNPKKKKNKGGSLSSPTKIGMLGLLATGEGKYIDAVRKEIGSWDPIPYDGKTLMDRNPNSDRAGCWEMAYTTILLSEYFLMTKDDSVLPMLKTYALSLAKSQDAAGLYGHKSASPDTMRSPGYGIMNQTSLACCLGMLLAQKCGIDVPGLDEAAAKSLAYAEKYIGKGTFPYGFHSPRDWQFNNNGMSGLAAVIMSVAGNKEGVKFFSGMAAASYGQLGTGHASTLFSSYWTPAGANFAGPEVTKLFFGKSMAYFNPRRQWTGDFRDVGREGRGEGEALLAYCLPRKALIITGREADPSLWLNAKEAGEAIAMGEIDYKGKSPEELLACFGHAWIPVRTQAVMEITKRIIKKHDKPADAADLAAVQAIFPKLREMLASGTPDQRICAMRCYLLACPEAELKARMETAAAILRDRKEPDDLRVAAVLQVSPHGKDSFPYFNDMLSFILEDRPSDRFGDVLHESVAGIDAIITGSLSMDAEPEGDDNPSERETAGEDVDGNPYTTGLVTDRDLYYRAAKKLMEHKRDKVRGVGVRMIRHMPAKDFALVADELDYLLRDDDTTYHSYHNPQLALLPAAQIYADFRIEEGMQYLVDILNARNGKWSFKSNAILKTLPMYGGNAKKILPALLENKDVSTALTSGSGRYAEAYRKLIDGIRNDPTPPALSTFEEVKQRSAAGK